MGSTTGVGVPTAVVVGCSSKPARAPTGRVSGVRWYPQSYLRKPSGNPVPACLNRSRVSRREWKLDRFVGTGVFPAEGVGGDDWYGSRNEFGSLDECARACVCCWYQVCEARCRRFPRHRKLVYGHGDRDAQVRGIGLFRSAIAIGVVTSMRMSLHPSCQIWQEEPRRGEAPAGEEEESGVDDTRARARIGREERTRARARCLSTPPPHVATSACAHLRATGRLQRARKGMWRRSIPKTRASKNETCRFEKSFSEETTFQKETHSEHWNLRLHTR